MSAIDARALGGGDGAARGARRGGDGDLCPPPVRRGEELTEQAAKVDWLNATFPAPLLSVEGFIALLGRMLNRPISGASDHGMLGFEKGVKLFAHHGSQQSPMGCIAYGGEGQGGRWLLQFTGEGCGFIHDWQAIAELLEGLDARITRLDLAVDFLNGEYTVDEAVSWHAMGGFTFDGRMAPKTELAGDWNEQTDGRTFYVGKRANGKCLRVYEKGKQLGDTESEWTRFEVQLGNRDRVIPFDALVRRDEYFAGCYPALEAIVDVAAEAIKTKQKAGETTLGHLVFHATRAYGKLFNALLDCGASYADLVDEVRIAGTPRRVNLSSMAAGVSWADVQAQLRRKPQ